MRFPFTTDWTPQVINPYPWTATLDDACSSLVKRGAWTNNVKDECGLSLTDACDAPPLMSHNEWQTWKQSVRRVSSQCAALMTSFEGCCQQRDLTREALPQDSGVALRLVPWTYFRDALPQCVSREPDLRVAKWLLHSDPGHGPRLPHRPAVRANVVFADGPPRLPDATPRMFVE